MITGDAIISRTLFDIIPTVIVKNSLHLAFGFALFGAINQEKWHLYARSMVMLFVCACFIFPLFLFVVTQFISMFEKSDIGLRKGLGALNVIIAISGVIIAITSTFSMLPWDQMGSGEIFLPITQVIGLQYSLYKCLCPKLEV